MKKEIKSKVFAGLIVLSCSAMFMACARQGQDTAPAVSTTQTAVADTAQPTESSEISDKSAQSTTEQQIAEAPLYTEQPRSLSPVECASCHNGQYSRLQESKSKHRFDCLDCHDKLHANIPSKNNYTDILPQCSSCHGLPHGDTFSGCAQCHNDPHSPLQIPFSGVSEDIANHAGKKVVACEVCHYETEGKEMETYPSKHNTEVGCTGCHGDEQHGIRPTCFDCHEPHTADQIYADCLVCHQPHSAMNILPYPKEISNTVCAACHAGIYDALQVNHTMHTELQCASCHITHGQIPKCQDCHGDPHGKAIHKRFPDCLDCHVDPHDLPVNLNS